MRFSLQQQDTSRGFCITRSAASPQHGQKPDKQALKLSEPRSFKPPASAQT